MKCARWDKGGNFLVFNVVCAIACSEYTARVLVSFTCPLVFSSLYTLEFNLLNFRDPIFVKSPSTTELTSDKEFFDCMQTLRSWCTKWKHAWSVSWSYGLTFARSFQWKFSRRRAAGSHSSKLESEGTCLSCLPVCICFVSVPSLRRRFKQSSGLANSNQKHSPWGRSNLQSKSTHSQSFITTWDTGSSGRRACACLCRDKNEVNAFLQIF